MAGGSKARLEVRQAKLKDVRAIGDLVRRAYADLPAYTQGEIRGQINNYSQGCFVAVLDGKIVGYCASMRLDERVALSDHTWDEVTGNGLGSRHSSGAASLRRAPRAGRTVRPYRHRVRRPNARICARQAPQDQPRRQPAGISGADPRRQSARPRPALPACQRVRTGRYPSQISARRQGLARQRRAHGLAQSLCRRRRAQEAPPAPRRRGRPHRHLPVAGARGEGL